MNVKKSKVYKEIKKIPYHKVEYIKKVFDIYYMDSDISKILNMMFTARMNPDYGEMFKVLKQEHEEDFCLNHKRG